MFTDKFSRKYIDRPLGFYLYSCYKNILWLNILIVHVIKQGLNGVFFYYLTAHSDMNVQTILVGNKSDLKDAREVATAEGKALAEAQGLFFMETSALDSSNVAAAFETVVKEIYNILSRKVMMSQELNKSVSHIENGKTVVLQGEGEKEEGAAAAAADAEAAKGCC